MDDTQKWTTQTQERPVGSSPRLFLWHSVWMLLLLGVISLSGFILQPDNSQLPIGHAHWLAILVLLTFLLGLCVRALMRTR